MTWLLSWATSLLSPQSSVLLREDETVEGEDGAVAADGVEAAGGFDDAAEADAHAAGHRALHGGLDGRWGTRAAIASQGVAQGGVDRLGGVGVDGVGPLDVRGDE